MKKKHMSEDSVSATNYGADTVAGAQGGGAEGKSGGGGGGGGGGDGSSSINVQIVPGNGKRLCGTCGQVLSRVFLFFPQFSFFDACRCTHTYKYVYLRIHTLTRVCRYICTRICIYMDVRIDANAYVFTCACTDVRE